MSDDDVHYWRARSALPYLRVSWHTLAGSAFTCKTTRRTTNGDKTRENVAAGKMRTFRPSRLLRCHTLPNHRAKKMHSEREARPNSEPT